MQDVAPLPDQLDEAAKYIKRLQINVEKLREKKQNLLRIESLNSSMRSGMVMDSESSMPHIDIHQTGSALVVNFVNGWRSCYNYQSLFNKTIRALHEGGAEVINGSFSIVGDRIFSTIHSEVRDSALLSTEARISERLHKIFYTDNAELDYAY
ncbi:hypothetical protein CRG98_000119 [Punica granatum]|uniref:BHLH domain-containing protein n=1 Tax=Punica granatum TaxID=22663 RepID=A0A2I0LFM4_PUNGR|nr:hypothetical protein CRG98_000119 [Punica granatum]